MIFSVYAYYCGTGEAVETAMGFVMGIAEYNNFLRDCEIPEANPNPTPNRYQGRSALPPAPPRLPLRTGSSVCAATLRPTWLGLGLG